ncbi:MAG: thioredoxin fold domain-containing protein [Chitinivibrionales bacterium]|nr:thioredoxin fold domain-containing protein [Chitinivibrionales bacterium]
MKKVFLVVVSFFFFVPFAAYSQIDLSNLKTDALEKEPAKEPVRIEVDHGIVSDSSKVTTTFSFTMPSDVYVYRAESLFFKIHFDEVTGLGDASVEMPDPVVHTNFDGTRVDVITNGREISVTREIRDSEWRMRGFIRYQACNKTTCFTPRKFPFLVSSNPEDSLEAVAPQSPSGGSEQIHQALKSFTSKGKASGYLGVQEFLSFLENPESGGMSFAGKNLWLIIGLILIGGIALNLTPCVLPMIPITLAVLGAGAQAGSKARGFSVGSFYGLGMAIAYGILGLVVTVTGAQFGIINSSPVFNIAIAVLFIVLSLAMFDVIHIDFTKYRSGVTSNQSKKGNLFVALFMGGVAALLAGACVAPVIISVVVYASTLYAKGQPTGLLLPFLLGLGMALPWPFAGAGLSILPKPGKWMNWVKGAFGVIILAVALHYGYTGVKLLKSMDTAVVESTVSSSDLQWRRLAEGLAIAQQQNKPVFVDFWATWCKNCLAMDATTFKDEQVKSRLEEYVLVKYKAEDPQDPQTKAVLEQFGIVGLPTFVVLTPRQVP